MLALTLALLLASAAPDDSPHRLQLTLNIGPLFPINGYGVTLGPSSSIEVDVLVWRWIRVGALLAAGYLPEHYRQFYPGDHGVFRLLAGADFLIPLSWGSLFAGLLVGPGFSNWTFDGSHVGQYPPASYDTAFGWVLAARARAGVEGVVLQRLVVGGGVAYALTYWPPDFGVNNFVEVELRVGARF